MNQMAHQAGGYPGFCSMKQIGVFLLPPGWDSSPSQGYPQHYVYQYPIIHLGGERYCESKVSCPRTQHNVSPPDKAWRWTARWKIRNKATAGRCHWLIHWIDWAAGSFGKLCRSAMQAIHWTPKHWDLRLKSLAGKFSRVFGEIDVCSLSHCLSH